MKTFQLLLIIFLQISFSILAQKKPTKVLVIGLDGLSVEGMKKASTPNIDQLFADGVVSLNTRTVMPSVTLPNWTSHLTSAGPEQHGVVNNDWTLEKHELNPIETDSDGYFPSIFKVLKDNNPKTKTAYYYNWKQLIYPINKKYLDEISFEENDHFEENYKKAYDFIKINKENPTLVFLYSVHTDHAGHNFKWMSQEYITALEQADAAIGNLIKDLKKENLFEDMHFMLITDHGGKGNGHGGTSKEEMEVPWCIVGPKIKKNVTMMEFNTNINTAATIAKLFKIKFSPASWIGQIPKSILK
jgi:predicted AlkP superfamily pyrophosphatase or phosphodiesterase